MLKNTWNSLAYPLLEQATQHFIESDEQLWLQSLTAPAIEDGGDDMLQRELKHLEDDGYLALDWRGDAAVGITGVTPKAKRACGAWPSDETVGTAVVDALEELAQKEDSPERKSSLRSSATALREIGVSGAGQLFGATLRQAVGL